MASERSPNNLIAGNDGSSLIGGGGNATLTSSSSNDSMKGGTAQDTFVYTSGNDVINNYQSGEIINFAASSDEFIYSYGNGQDNFFKVGLEDSINLLNVSLEDIASTQITDNGVSAQLINGGSLNINGQAGSFKLGGQTFHVDYLNKSWS